MITSTEIIMDFPLGKTITLCSVYIPPHSSLSLIQLKNVSDQLPTPFIIMGDFNGHNLYYPFFLNVFLEDRMLLVERLQPVG
jgi:hypothetical protein